MTDVEFLYPVYKGLKSLNAAKTFQVTIGGWMDKPSGVYTYNGILFSLKKKRNSHTCYNIGDPESFLLSEISQSQKDKPCRSPFNEVLSPFIQTESRMVLIRTWRGRGVIV